MGAYMESIANRISRRRKELGLTQKELAERLYVSDKTVSRWETEKQIPDAVTMQNIAAALDISVSELYGAENIRESVCHKSITFVKIRKIFGIGFVIAVMIIVLGFWASNRELNSQVSCQTDEFPMYMLTGYDQSIVEWVEYCNMAGEDISHVSAFGGETAYYLFYLPRGCEATELEYSYHYGLRGRVLRLNFKNLSDIVNDEYYLCYMKFPCKDFIVLKTYIDGHRVDSYTAYAMFTGLCENILFK